jgi:hypothetical protein
VLKEAEPPLFDRACNTRTTAGMLGVCKGGVVAGSRNAKQM